MQGRPVVVSVSAGHAHGPYKPVRAKIELVEGLGVDGDAHAGSTVQHRSRARAHPHWINLRQVHLLGVELHEELAVRGLPVEPGVMGENVLTEGIDLLGLPVGTTLRLGPHALVELTGLRSPCAQLEGVRDGLMAAVLTRGEDGNLVRRSGVMAIVRTGGDVASGAAIHVALPARPHQALEPV